MTARRRSRGGRKPSGAGLFFGRLIGFICFAYLALQMLHR